MAAEIPFCDTPGQSALVGVLAGAVGGLVGLAAGLGTTGVVGVAAALAVVCDLGGHALRGDDQFRAAVRQVTDDG